jgi:hypothetical protein
LAAGAGCGLIIAQICRQIDGYDMASTMEKGQPALCFPENIKTGQVARGAFKWMRDHPEKLNESGSRCMFAFLLDAFGCKYPK